MQSLVSFEGVQKYMPIGFADEVVCGLRWVSTFGPVADAGEHVGKFVIDHGYSMSWRLERRRGMLQTG